MKNNVSRPTYDIGSSRIIYEDEDVRAWVGVNSSIVLDGVTMAISPGEEEDVDNTEMLKNLGIPVQQDEPEPVIMKTPFSIDISSIGLEVIHETVFREEYAHLAKEKRSWEISGPGGSCRFFQSAENVFDLWGRLKLEDNQNRKSREDREYRLREMRK